MIHAPRRALVVALLSFALVLTSISGAASAGATATSATTVSQLESTLEVAMFNLLNQERVAGLRPALKWATALHVSAHAHNLAMARYNMMSHQCPGEASPGTRITKSGYKWRNWGENVGWTTDESVAGILYMEKLMFGERAPNNGHRLNILGNFKNVGIDVYIDTVHHHLWYTQDFGTPL